MAGRFPPDGVDALLVACHRCCCVCHRFCGVKIEIDHMLPGAAGGDDTMENAISVCFECHAEIHMYNDAHPRGRKFRPGELRRHKEQWLALCQRSPPGLRAATARRPELAGPIEALINELEFNASIARSASSAKVHMSSPLSDRQFQRALTRGALSVLREDVKGAMFSAYAAIRVANQVHRHVANDAAHKQHHVVLANLASEAALAPMETALAALTKQLAGDSPDERASAEAEVIG